MYTRAGEIRRRGKTGDSLREEGKYKQRLCVSVCQHPLHINAPQETDFRRGLVEPIVLKPKVSRYCSGKISAYRTSMKLIWACRDVTKVFESDFKPATTPQNHRFLEA